MTYEQLRNDPNYYEHHSATRRGYVSRRGGAIVEPYKGEFGEGYVVKHPNWTSSQYVEWTYYIVKNAQEVK